MLYYTATQRTAEESDGEFRERIARELRTMGHVVEAHEAFNNQLYDDPSGRPMIGIMGVLAQAMQNRSYQGDPIGNDIASGVLSTNPPRDEHETLEALMGAILWDIT